MEYRVLGPLEVLAAGGEKLALGGAMQQSVLAALLIRAGKTVALQRIIDDLWDEPPETATQTIRAYVSRLRRELPNGVIESRPGGYRLALDGSNFDLETFERQAEEGHRALAAGQCEEAARLLRSALALWRGPALAGLTSEALQRQAERLEELRLTALEDRLEADLGCGREAEIVPELKTLVAEHPFRERLRAQLMRAFSRSGRPGEALALYRETRGLLVDELGMEPGQELRELEQAILRQDAELEAPKRKRSTAPAATASVEREPPGEQPAPREVRKTVTILSCDIVDSTARIESSDPEVMRSRLARFFEEMKAIVERHGGTVEKYIGDAVMAFFGVPRAHEDDALRACRAAIEMRKALPALGFEGRIGLMTGEVVTGTEERLATGDSVVVAARLEQAAAPGEVLIGRSTFELAREAVEVEALEPLDLKGKTQPVEAYRLKSVHEPLGRPAGTPFIGRVKELAAITRSWKRATSERRCELVTIVGEAGIGKSRLVDEALASIDGPVIRGRCLPYGEGITYWPVLEVLKQLDARPSDPAAATAIRSLLGESQTQASAEEIAWAFRKLIEEQAPLIVVYDDIHWGEEAFIDLLEHVVFLSSGAPILLLAMARPELTERRPDWPVTLRLEPLAATEAEELIPTRISGDLRGRIARAAGGNPLFVEEMVAIAGDAGSEVVVPPTLQALLATRLDQLDLAERSVLERGAVEGEVFHRGAVQAMGPEESQVTPRLASLVRKGLIRRVKPQLVGEDGFRFHHLLIRDAAYASLPKATRADLHRLFAAWLEDRASEFVELEEIVGYHLERAWRYCGELGQADDGELADAARRHLTAAGRRALARQDFAAAANLLERAAALVPEGEIDIKLELNLVHALEVENRKREALHRAVSVAERAAATGDRVGELCARVAAEGFSGDPARLSALIKQAVPLFEEEGDDFALMIAYHARGTLARLHGQQDASVKASERAATHGRRAEVPNQGLVAAGSSGRLYGTTPVSELLAWEEEQDTAVRNHPRVRGQRAVALAMLGRFAEAWSLLVQLRAELADRGADLMLTVMDVEDGAEVELLAGEPAAAVVGREKGCQLLERTEWQEDVLSTWAGRLAQAYYMVDRIDDAEVWAGRAAELGTNDDAETQVIWRQVRAKVLARRGKHRDGELLAREAVEICEKTDLLNDQASVFADLAAVLLLGGRTEDAAEALEQALVRYDRKENLVMAGRVQAHLDELRLSLASAERA
jgi:class 3 adenylate cyclase